MGKGVGAFGKIYCYKRAQSNKSGKYQQIPAYYLKYNIEIYCSMHVTTRKRHKGILSLLKNAVLYEK